MYGIVGLVSVVIEFLLWWIKTIVFFSILITIDIHFYVSSKFRQKIVLIFQRWSHTNFT